MSASAPSAPAPLDLEAAMAKSKDPMQAAHDLFKPKAPELPVAAPRAPAVPGVKETVTLRIDKDVLDSFQDEGPGWQERINAALRKAAGL